MPGQTNSDRILELERQTSALIERVERLRQDLERMERGSKVDSTPAEFKDQRDRLIRLEVKLEQHEKQRSEEHGKSWAVKLAVVSALIGSVVTILSQWLSRFLPIK